jgi:predicted enzyme related to lactoylglutathione lyase
VVEYLWVFHYGGFFFAGRLLWRRRVQVVRGVPDAAAEQGRLTTLGAEIHKPVKDVGGGIKVVSLRDSFGNLFSIIENPHFKLDDLR